MSSIVPKPICRGQEIMAENWNTGKVAHVVDGPAGTGKTTFALLLALDAVMNKRDQRQILICRNSVATRDLGFLPGTLEEKMAPFFDIYGPIIDQVLGRAASDKMIEKGIVSFCSTSFLRGRTFDNCVIILDETQNLTYHEIETVITRVGQNSKIIILGDYDQADSHGDDYYEWISRATKQPALFTFTTLDHDDIVRSGFVADYLRYNSISRRPIVREMIIRNTSHGKPVVKPEYVSTLAQTFIDSN